MPKIAPSARLREEITAFLTNTSSAESAGEVGLAARRTGLRLEWQEVLLPHDGVAERVLALDLAHLSPGRYRLTVTIAAVGQEPAAAAREIEVVAR